jgi:DNA repair protein RecO (recombination protein O)
MEEDYENFHLIFMLKLCRFLGFGVYNLNEVLAGQVTDPATEKILDELLKAGYETSLKINNSQRRIVLDLLLKFYSAHMENLGEIKSVQVLRDVFM